MQDRLLSRLDYKGEQQIISINQTRHYSIKITVRHHNTKNVKNTTHTRIMCFPFSNSPAAKCSNVRTRPVRLARKFKKIAGRQTHRQPLFFLFQCRSCRRFAPAIVTHTKKEERWQHRSTKGNTSSRIDILKQNAHIQIHTNSSRLSDAQPTSLSLRSTFQGQTMTFAPMQCTLSNDAQHTPLWNSTHSGTLTHLLLLKDHKDTSTVVDCVSRTSFTSPALGWELVGTILYVHTLNSEQERLYVS